MDRRLDALIRKHGLSRYRDIFHALSGPAIRLKSLKSRKRIPTGATKLGGYPDVPHGFRWPMRGKQPLSFIAQIQLGPTLPVHTWPESGRLLFFYDAKDQPWGFEPKNRKGSAVVYLPPSIKKLHRTPMPRNRDKKPYDGGPLHELAVRTSVINTIPPGENPALRAILTTPKLRVAYERLWSEYWPESFDKPNHQIFGWPEAVQNDMEEECQLAFHGVDCGGEDDAAESPQSNEYRGGAARWRLLLQVGSDDDLGLIWGDLGKIYFFATAESCASLRFDETWTILQCG